MIVFGIVAGVAAIILVVAVVVLTIAFVLRRDRRTTMALEQIMVLAFLVGLLMAVLLVLDGLIALVAAITNR